MKKQAFLLIIFLYLSCYADRSVIDIKSRVRGAILGSAIGDALGRIPEMYWISCSKKKLEQDFPLPIKHFGDFRKQDFENGIAIYTDDTQMARLVIDALLEHKNYINQTKFDCLNSIMWDISRKFVDWVVDPDGGLSARRAPGVGCTKASRRLKSLFEVTGYYKKNNILPDGKYMFDVTSTVFDRICGGDIVPYDENKFDVVAKPVCKWSEGEGGDLKPFSEGGCGSVMRAYPLGLFFMDNIEYATKLSELHSCLTHRAPIARAACASMAAGMVKAMNGYTVEEILNEMIKYAKEYDIDTSKMIQDSIEKSKANPSEEEIREYLEKLEGKLANQAIAATAFLFACENKDLLRALRLAVNFYGDSDSVGAMVGALVGAHLGSDVLFEKDNFNNYLKPLEDIGGLINLSDKVIEFIEQTRPPNS